MLDQSSLSILIVEDDAMFRSMAMQVFGEHKKMYAGDAKLGLNKYKEFCPDITLLDIGLPDKSGLLLLDDIIAYDPEAFVVMLTSSCIAADVSQAKKSGAAGYIIKPCTPNKISQCLDRYAQFKAQIASLTPEERAKHYINTMRIEGVDEDVATHEKQSKKPVQKQQQYDASSPLAGLGDEVIAALANWHVLFVDDYLVNRQRAQQQLAKLGCHVDVAENSQEIVGMAAQKEYSLIFLDTNIPGEDGYKTSKRIRAMEKELQRSNSIIIAMIEAQHEVEENLWQLAGMNNFLRKPTRFSALRDILVHHVKLTLEAYIE